MGLSVKVITASGRAGDGAYHHASTPQRDRIMSTPAQELEFPSQGVTLRAGFFAATSDALLSPAGRPCVVMGHGLGGVRAAGLTPFAEAFAQAGMHVLVFDYRGFGSSDGVPRQVVSVKGQLQDWAAAIAFARSLEGVDPARIATWGSSFSGAHSVAAAVEDGRIAAVSSQGAMMDGLASLFNLVRQCGLAHVLRSTGLALRDGAAAALGGARVTAAVVGPPGSSAVLNTPDSEPGYLAIAPKEWVNEISTSWMLTLSTYRPNRMTPKLPCPALFCIATDDVVVPPSAMEDGARRAPEKIEVKRYAAGHFDMYVPPVFNQVVADQTAFFTTTLKPR